MTEAALNAYASISAETAGPCLKRWRKVNRIKQDYVAACVGVTQAAVSRWENGHDIPSSAALHRIEAMMAGFERDDVAAERAIIAAQMSVRGLFRLDGIVFKGASAGFVLRWPGFMRYAGVALEDRLINESACFLSDRTNYADLKLGRIAYVRGVSHQHVETSGVGMLHSWMACARKLDGETYLEMIYEPAPKGAQTGILEVLNL